MGFEADYCGAKSSLDLISEEGTIPLCFINLFLYGGNTLFLLILGSWRVREVRRKPNVDITYTKLQSTKVVLCLLLGFLALLRSIATMANGTSTLSTIFAGFYVSLVSVLAVYLTVTEYSRGFRNNWIIRTYWTVNFLISSVEFQTNLYMYRYDAAFFISLLNFIASFVLAVIGLFMNTIHETYERLLSTNDISEQGVGYDRKSNPEDTNIFSKLTFSWLNPLLLLGYKRPLESTDLFDIRQGYHGAEVSDTFYEKWQEELVRPKPALTRAFRRAFARQFYIAGVLKFFHDCLLFVGPVILEAIVAFIKTPGIPNYVGFGYVLAMFSASVMQTILLHQYFFMTYNVGMKARSAVVTAVYKKAFSLSNKARKESTQGEIVNLQAVDSGRLQELFPYLHTVWSAPFQMIVSIVMLWQLLGPSVLAGVSVMVLTAPLNTIIMKKLGAIQKEMMKSKDARTKIMNEVLNGVRVIKFFAWERSFIQKILDIRNTELKTIKKTLYLRAMALLFWTATPVLVSTVTFTIFSLTGGELTAEVAFTALALFNILRFPLNVLPMIFSSLVEAKVSFTRLQKFLLAEELDPLAVEHEKDPEYPILVRGGSFQWDASSSPPTLSNIDLKVPQGKLIAVVGSVGSGKSSLLSAILGEIPKTSGRVNVSGNMAYVAQQAWVQNATLKDNILFGKPYVQKKYAEATDVCELTPDIAILPNGDQTEIGEKGINLSGGQKQRVSLARAVYQDCDIYLFDDCLSAVDAHVGRQIFNNCIMGVLAQKTRILVTHQLQFVNQADLIVVMKAGRISEIGTYNQLMESRQEFYTLISTHVKESKSESSADVKKADGKKEETKKPTTGGTGKLVQAEERDTGNVDSKVYKAYMLALGGTFVVAGIIASFVVESGLRLGNDFWLSYWSSNVESGEHSLTFYLGVYSLLSFIYCIIVYLRAIVLNVAGLKSAKVLHDSMLATVMRAPMSFFDTTPIGRILNRFSKDQYTIDDSLMRTLGSFVQTGFQVLSVLVVIGVATPFFLTALLPMAFLYRHIQKYYLQSSRELKRLDSITRSPVYAQFSETLSGLSTIRTYGREADFNAANNSRLDLNQCAYYALQSANRWLGVRLEFIGTCVVSGAAAFAVIQRDTIGAGLAGLSISYALQMTGILNWLVRMATEVETSMVSVERVQHYATLPTEAPAVVPNHRPPANWPSEGQISFKNVKMRYREGLDLVLKGVAIDIKPKEKIGVVGRTGAGKSSLMLALFRLVELTEGSVTIDNIDISTIGLDDLREKLSIIPQEPTLFTGTVRSNLDPFNQHSDMEIWQVLTAVHLHAAIENLPLKLDAPVAESGENFSVGQRQLLCLGRALLRRAKILVMDEATASIDFETDSLIQKTIREEFKDVTVLTIAHRINTIMDYDRVMVLDHGVIAECDSPTALSTNPSTIFYSMVHKSGTTSTDEIKPADS